jgi:hypothetical protein
MRHGGCCFLWSFHSRWFLGSRFRCRWFLGSRFQCPFLDSRCRWFFGNRFRCRFLDSRFGYGRLLGNGFGYGRLLGNGFGYGWLLGNGFGYGWFLDSRFRCPFLDCGAEDGLQHTDFFLVIGWRLFLGRRDFFGSFGERFLPCC